MSLIQNILNYLREFTNPIDEIRSQAEENINILISQDPFDVINSLLEIIDNNPSQNEAYFCAILIRNYLKGKVLVDISQKSPDFFEHAKNILLRFASDSRFPQNLNMFLISEILIYFYSVSIIEESGSFSEFIPFLISLLDNNNFRSNSLETLINAYIFNTLEEYIPQIIDKCNLADDDFEYRSTSFRFYINCIQFASFDFRSFLEEIIHQIPQIFDDMPDKQFNECFEWIFRIYESNDKYKQLSLFFPQFLLQIYPRLADPNGDELSKVNLIDDICKMLSSTYFFDFISQEENSSQFLEALLIMASNPIQFYDLYNEIGSCIKKLYATYFDDNNQSLISSTPERRDFYFSIKEMEECPNLFVSSLFSKFSNELSEMEKAIGYATIEDDADYSRIIIRHNGLSQLKKIIIKNKQVIDDETKIDLFGILMNLYEFYEDEKIMKDITLLSFYFSNELIQMKIGDIISLCESKITTEIVCCASLYCVDPDIEYSEFLAGNLYQSTIELMTHDIYALSNVLTFLNKVINSAGPELTYKFIDQVMEVILDDPNCFTNKCLQDFIKCTQEFDESCEFARAIFLKLMEYIESIDDNDLLIDENQRILHFAIKSVPFYADFIPEFENKYLKDVLDIIEKRFEEYNFNIRGVSIKCVSKLAKYIVLNDTMLHEIINQFENLLQKEDNIYVIKCLMHLLSQIIFSILDNDDEANIDQFIQIYPTIFQIIYNNTSSINQQDKVLDKQSYIDFGKILKSLLGLFNTFLDKNLQMTTELVLNFFLKNESNEEEESCFGSNIFKTFFIHMWSTLLTIVDANILDENCPAIVQILIDYAFSDAYVAPMDKAKSIISLSNFFYQNEMPAELIFDYIWNGLIPLIDENKNNVSYDAETDTNNTILIYLLTKAISFLIIITVRYHESEINLKSIIPIISSNINLLLRSDQITFIQLFELINICSSDSETAFHAIALMKKAVSMIQNNQVAKSAIVYLYNVFQKSSEIPEFFDPLCQIVFQVMNSSDHE